MPKSTRRASMQQAMLNINKHTFSSEVRLMMECTEEELLPCQKTSYKLAIDEFNRVNKYIADVQAGKVQMTSLPNSTLSIVNEPQPQNHDPDVIVIGESPPQQKKTAPKTTVPSVNTNIIIPPLPTESYSVPTSTQSLMAVPQQVYKFVSGQQSNVVKVGNQIFIRPMMTVAPQLNNPNVTMAQLQPFSPVPLQNSVRPISLLKRQGETDVDGQPNKKYMSAVQSKKEVDSSGNWVPLDEFYYGKKEGDPTYVEEKGEYRFKCWYCSKMLYNNIKTMMHMQGHIDSEKQQNLDLSDLTQCKHCYKQFDTPFEMQTHIEKVHMYNSNVLMCRICEKDCDSRVTLTSHMRQNHNACEMPYMCQLCEFRSSMYSDVVDHFKKKHDSSANLLCLYCLRAFNVKFISTGWGQTQNYYHHLLKHQSKNKVKKCQVCKLTFFLPQDLKAHRKKDHLPNVKGVIGMNSKYTTPDQVMIKVPEQGLQPKQIKSLNAPAVSKVRDNHLLLPCLINQVRCLECKIIMGTQDHYKKYIQCSMCRFATSCSFAYANHMMGFHSGQMTTLTLNIPKEKPMEHIMYCMCGYASRYGNNIANHMVYCTKRTCYKDKPDTPIHDYDNKEMQDPRNKPGASLLDVLGLVKKTPPSAAFQSSSSSIKPSQGKKSTDWFRINLNGDTKDKNDGEDEENIKDDVKELDDVKTSTYSSKDENSAITISDKVNIEKDNVNEENVNDISDHTKTSHDSTTISSNSPKPSEIVDSFDNDINEVKEQSDSIATSDNLVEKTDGEIQNVISLEQSENTETPSCEINENASDKTTKDDLMENENSSNSLVDETIMADPSKCEESENNSKRDQIENASADVSPPMDSNISDSEELKIKEEVEKKDNKLEDSANEITQEEDTESQISELIDAADVDHNTELSSSESKKLEECFNKDEESDNTKPEDEESTPENLQIYNDGESKETCEASENSAEKTAEDNEPGLWQSAGEDTSRTINKNLKHSNSEEQSNEINPNLVKSNADVGHETQIGTDPDTPYVEAQAPSKTSHPSAGKSFDRLSQRNETDDNYSHYSDDRGRSYDRNHDYRDSDRSHDRRCDDYNRDRDRSRDYHNDRDRKYDRDYDRHGRDRNREYNYHGNRDYRRDNYQERDRDRNRDNRNWQRRGQSHHGNYRDRSGYY